AINQRWQIPSGRGRDRINFNLVLAVHYPCTEVHFNIRDCNIAEIEQSNAEIECVILGHHDLSPVWTCEQAEEAHSDLIQLIDDIGVGSPEHQLTRQTKGR